MHILLVEDNQDIAENIFEYFEPRGHVLDYAADGASGLHLALGKPFDVIVLDIMLPSMDGLMVCRRLREMSCRNVPVLMLTARDELEDKLEGFSAGADDYLVKPFSLQELEARLWALTRRSKGMGESRVLRVADLKYDTATLEVRRAGQKISLSATARKLLELLMRNTHRVVLREELEQALWGEDVPDSEVLRAHIYVLRNAIDKPFEEKLLHTIHGAGYRLAPKDD